MTVTIATYQSIDVLEQSLRHRPMLEAHNDKVGEQVKHVKHTLLNLQAPAPHSTIVQQLIETLWQTTLHKPLT